jgi:hypothetical protein
MILHLCKVLEMSSFTAILDALLTIMRANSGNAASQQKYLREGR